MSSNLSLVEARLPPGFRFHPRDEELVCDYLMKKLARCDLQPPLLVEVDLNKSEPWDIPETACVGQKEWYFYSQRDRKYATGLRTNRATASGYWKATGKDRPVLRKSTLVGMRKTLVFYQGRAPKGRKTDWVMHEFRLEGPLLPPKLSSSKEDWVLCRVFYKSRDIAAGKLLQGMAGSVISSCYGDTRSSSSSLPPLMEPYHNITFDHHHHQTQTQGANAKIDNDNMSNSNLISTTTPGNGEQVPCFSSFATNQTNQAFSPSHMLAASSQQLQLVDSSSNPIRTKISSDSPTFGPISTFPCRDDVATYLNPSFSCEKRVLQAVLDQYLNKNYDQDSIINHHPKVIDHQSSSFGDHEGSTSDQCFLSDHNVGLPNTNTMWYHSVLN